MPSPSLTLTTEHDIVDVGGLLTSLTGISGWTRDQAPSPGPMGLGTRASFRAEQEVPGELADSTRHYYSGRILLWDGYAEVYACETDLDGMEIGTPEGGSWGIELDLAEGPQSSPYAAFFSAPEQVPDSVPEMDGVPMAAGPAR